MRTISEVFREPSRGALVPEFILRRAAELAGIHESESIGERARRADSLRRGIVESLGLERIPRSTVLPTHVGSVECDGFRVEKLVYETLTGLPVPAHLYLPAGAGPHPAIVHVPGHWMENSKLEPDLQRLNFRLARSGIAVLCYDTLGQGERRVGWHQHGQLATLLVGFTCLGVMVAESIDALGLLEQRDDIDGTRLGMTGTSGGGFSTIFAAAIDERISAAAVACIVNTHLSQIRDAAFGTGWDGWVDLCNQVPGLCALAPMADVIACAAPREMLVVHAIDDPPFPAEGAREVQAQAQMIYEIQDAAGRFNYAEVAGGHGLHRATRDTVATFLADALQVKPALERVEALLSSRWEVTHDVALAERPQRLAPVHVFEGECLETVVDSNGPLVRAVLERARQLREERLPLTTEALATALGPWPERVPLGARVSNHLVLEEIQAQRVAFDAEDGVRLDAVITLPDVWSDDFPAVFVMLDEGGMEQALRSVEAKHAREDGCALLLPDLRGTGDSAASEFEVATAAWMLDRDLLNQRVWDVLRTVDFLSERYSTGQQIDKGRIVVWGSEAFGLVALLACALDSRIAAGGATGLKTLEALIVERPRATPMLYRYRLLELLDIDDLCRLASPRAFSCSTSNARATVADALASVSAAS